MTITEANTALTKIADALKGAVQHDGRGTWILTGDVTAMRNAIQPREAALGVIVQPAPLFSTDDRLIIRAL